MSAHRPAARTTTLAKLAVLPVALIASGIVVSQASYSAYSDTTTNPESNWTTGSVALSDDDANSALFTVKNAKPGTSGTRCITVTSTGDLPSSVKFYVTDASSTNDLATAMNITITQGTGGSFGSCDGFAPLPGGATLYSGNMAWLGMTSYSYGNGLGGWTPTGDADEARTYKVDYSVAADAPNTTQGGTAAGGLTWEAQSR